VCQYYENTNHNVKEYGTDRFSSSKETIHDTVEKVNFIRIKITASRLGVEGGDIKFTEMMAGILDLCCDNIKTYKERPPHRTVALTKQRNCMQLKTETRIPINKLKDEVIRCS